MNAQTTRRTSDIPRIQHNEAMAITAEENRRFLELMQTLDGDAWRLPTDCTRWDVRAVVVHVVAGAEAQASIVEFLRQLRAGRPLTAGSGGVHWVDGFNEAGLRARAPS